MSALRRLTALFVGTILGLGLAAALLTLTASAGGPPAIYSWRYQPIQSGNGDFSPGNTGVVRDALGRLHLTYIVNHRLYYGVLSQTTWLTQAVAPDRDVTVQTLAVDSSGRPHIAFVENIVSTTEGYLYHAVLSGTTWLITAVDGGPVGTNPPGCQADLALDAADRPHIAYGRLPEVRYAVLSGTTWLTQTIEAGAYGYLCTQLAVEPAGVPHVVFYDLDPSYAGALEYATRLTTTWSIQTVETGTQSTADSEFGLPAGLALDSANRPHVAYYTGGSHLMRYAVLSDSVWVSTTLPTPPVDGLYRGGLILDALDQPHLVVRVVTLSDSALDEPHPVVLAPFPYYFTLSQTQWISQEIDSSLGAGLGVALALDESGRPVVSYANTYTGQILVAFGWQPTTAIFLPLVLR